MLIRQEQPEQNLVEQPEQQEQPPAIINTETSRLSHRRQSSSACEGADGRAEKRAEVTKDDILEASHAEANVTKANESSELFVSDFDCPDGHIITAANSLAKNPLTSHHFPQEGGLFQR
ncbi:hypothetical protein RHSIM_Rhsim01G0120100 [Rhododendron simsii]|uniref:Uncharacterized protein n=1 Tax=Rhododendron simsii TaxID=118357 RepID=A0A834LZV1_RHOSS|nr:hypothetical protein RHSIM_Rhsim01G0120100 [Rhododendron simsii]